MLGFILLLGAFLLNLLMGSVTVPLNQVLNLMLDSESVEKVYRVIVVKNRLPAAVSAVLAGAALSASGLYMQTFFRNPVAGPFILGISSGSALGVSILILGGSAFGISFFSLGWLGSWSLIIAASLGSIFVFSGIYALSSRLKDHIVLLIVGLMLSSLIAAVVQILQSFSDQRSLQLFVIWTFGGFRDITNSQLLPFAMTVFLGIGMLLYVIKPANLILLGEEQALGMGVNLASVKKWIIFGACLLAAVVTAFCGPIGFIGLAVPHLARALFKTEDHRILLPGSILYGAVIALICNLLSTVPGTQFALPLNAVTAIFGAPAVVWIILRNQNSTGGFR